jgi:predicted component of type VI protein secretion system
MTIARINAALDRLEHALAVAAAVAEFAARKWRHDA